MRARVLRLRSQLLIIALMSCSMVAMADVSPAALERVATQLEMALEAHRNLSAANNGYDAMFRRDPMKPLINVEGMLTGPAGMTSGLSVQGIIWSGDRPLAVIDDELLGRGEKVGPYTIQEVLPDGIIVEKNGQAQLIPLDREAGK